MLNKDIQEEESSTDKKKKKGKKAEEMEKRKKVIKVKWRNELQSKKHSAKKTTEN